MPDATPAIKAVKAVLTGLKRRLDSVPETSAALAVSARTRASSSSYQKTSRWRLSQEASATILPEASFRSVRPACPFLTW